VISGDGDVVFLGAVGSPEPFVLRQPGTVRAPAARNRSCSRLRVAAKNSLNY
jgi:hypothetical protein